MTYFTGFSTIGVTLTRHWTYYDIELVNRDLWVHFNTRIGERVMRPLFGCRIWDWLFQPLTSGLREQIVYECQNICLADGRVTIIDTQVTELAQGVQVALVLSYAPQNVVQTFTMNFEQRDAALYGNQQQLNS